MGVVESIFAANARVRAWRAYGLPIEGQATKGVVSDLVWWDLKCLTCGMEGTTCGNLEIGLNSIARSCPHLAPLLGEDPPEVRDLTLIELLAGDPPG